MRGSLLKRSVDRERGTVVAEGCGLDLHRVVLVRVPVLVRWTIEEEHSFDGNDYLGFLYHVHPDADGSD